MGGWIKGCWLDRDHINIKYTTEQKENIALLGLNSGILLELVIYNIQKKHKENDILK